MPSGSRPGEHRGGRTKGTPNKATQDVRAQLAALGCDPIEGMAKIAMDAANPPELRGKMFAELAGYIAPKRKAIDHSSDDGSMAPKMTGITVTFVRPDEGADLIGLDAG